MSIHYELNGFRAKLRAEKQYHTYANLAQLYGINSYYLWNIVTDDNYQPPLKVASTLGVVLMRPAPACPNCGDVHTKKTCPMQYKPRPPRLAIRLDDPRSAARSIRRHMTKDQIAALVAALEE